MNINKAVNVELGFGSELGCKNVYLRRWHITCTTDC